MNNYLVTTIVQVTVFPSTLTVIVVVPDRFAVTRPVADTEAVADDLEE